MFTFKKCYRQIQYTFIIWNIISIAFSDGQINRWTRLDIELLLQLKSLILVEFVSSSSSIVLVIINDIVKINNITVPIFVTL